MQVGLQDLIPTAPRNTLYLSRDIAGSGSSIQHVSYYTMKPLSEQGRLLSLLTVTR
jgi:hypothetical protein